MNEPRIVTVMPLDMLSMSIVVFFIGTYLNRKIRFLGENYVPPAVTGGLLFSIGTMALYFLGEVQVEFDMRYRDLLLLVFFSTIGLGAKLSILRQGGKALFLLAAVTGIFLVLQNLVGVGIALAFDAHPAYGLLAGSISFAGGHGTAIAWGQTAEDAGLPGAIALGNAFATFGLLVGGLIGGPIARRLMASHDIRGASAEASSVQGAELAAGAKDDDWLDSVLTTLLALALCVNLGGLVNRLLVEHGLELPGFLTALFVGMALTNIADLVKHPLNVTTVDRFGTVSLHLFIAMSMMAMQIWALSQSLAAITVVLLAQVLLMTVFAIQVVFRVMGKDYDAVVIAAGFTGMGLGATPVAIANMDSVTSRYGPSVKAFLVVPLVGAFFIDVLNAGTLQFFIRGISALFGGPDTA